MRAYHRPEGCSPRSFFSRRLAASPAETLRQRLHGRVHFPPTSLADYSSARFACPPSREDLRAGFPCALGHPWLVTLAPANWGPVFFRTRDVRHRGNKEYAGPKFCLDNKLCKSCVNALEIEGVANSRFSVSQLAATLLATASRSRRDRTDLRKADGRPLRRAGTHRQSAGDAGKLVAFQKIESGCEGGIELDSTSFDLFLHFIAPPQS